MLWAALPSVMLAASLGTPSVEKLDALEAPVVEAVQKLEAMSPETPCLARLLRERPFTDSSLSRVGGNVPQPLFRFNYVRELPLVGNALRQSIDDYERKGRLYSAPGVKAEGLYYDRAVANVVANLDLLDLYRNAWLDKLQDLDDTLNEEETADMKQKALESARNAARDYVHLADIKIPKEKLEQPLCDDYRED